MMALEQTALAQIDWVGFGNLRFRAFFVGAIGLGCGGDRFFEVGGVEMRQITLAAGRMIH
jgi:hypothetical protein